jgi:hypothetical protein
MLVKPEQSTHWYTTDGEPRYGATLREARKENLLPSVTTVLSIVAQPGLDAWKQEQAIMAALTLPRLDNEPLDAFARRVVDDSKRQASEAADVGSAIHAAIEEYIKDGTIIPVGGYGNVLSQAREWIDAELDLADDCGVEVSGVGDGYAGRIDFVGHDKQGRRIIVDFKTQNVKKYPRVYSKYKHQLAAYAGMETPIRGGDITQRLGNLIISTGEVRGVWFKELDDADHWRQGFEAALRLWQVEKGYQPV